MSVDKIVVQYEQDMTKLKADTDAAIANNLKLEKSSEKAGKTATAEFNKAAQSADKLSNEVSGTSGKMQSFQNSITKVGAAIGIAFGVQQLIAFGKASVEAFAESERAAQQLLFALNGRVDVQQRLISQAEQLQKTTTFEDDAIVAAQAYLATQGRTEEQIKKTIQAATQYATVFGGTVNDAVVKLDATYEGNIGRLGRVDDRFKTLTLSQLENGAAIDLINEKYKGFAENALNTTAGKIDQMKNQWGDFQEDVGSGLLTGFSAWRNTVGKQYEFIAKGFSWVKDKIVGSAEEGNKQLGNLANATANYQKVAYAELQKLAKAGNQDAANEIARRQDLFGDNMEKLKSNVSVLQSQVDGLTIGTQAYIDKVAELRKAKDKLKKAEDDLTHSLGQQTEADKKAESDRKAADDKRKQAADKEKADLIELRKLQKTLRDEALKASLDARNQELFDIQLKATNMQQAGLDQVAIDEFTRIEEKKVNDKYDKIEEDESKKRQDQMLDDLNALVDADEEAKDKMLAKTKKTEEEIRAIRKASFESAVELGNELFELGNALREAEIASLNKKRNDELEALDEEFGIKQKEETAYEKKKREIQEKFAAEEREVKLRQAKADRDKALFNIAIGTAENVIKAGLNPILIALAIALGATQAAVVAARPLPQFREGVVDYDGVGTGTSDSNVVRISKGESIITASSTSKKQKELEALNISPEEFDRLIYRDYVTPALRKQKENMAEQMAASMKLQNGFNDRNLLRAMRDNKTVELGPNTIQSLAENMKPKKTMR